MTVPVVDAINFNPRSREGSDGKLDLFYGGCGIFQSTLPRGERPAWDGIPVDTMMDFNPRSREGSDDSKTENLPHEPISIHAPARGATQSKRLDFGETVFQSTLPRGERRAMPRQTRLTSYFNPRSREGSDEVSAIGFSLLTDFNPRSREGSDTYRFDVYKRLRISIHAPARGATRFWYYD